MTVNTLHVFWLHLYTTSSILAIKCTFTVADFPR